MTGLTKTADLEKGVSVAGGRGGITMDVTPTPPSTQGFEFRTASETRVEVKARVDFKGVSETGCFLRHSATVATRKCFLLIALRSLAYVIFRFLRSPPCCASSKRLKTSRPR